MKWNRNTGGYWGAGFPTRLRAHSFIKFFSSIIQVRMASEQNLGVSVSVYLFSSLILKSTASMWTARSHHDLLTLSSPAELSTEPMSPERPPLKWRYLRQPSSPTSPCRTSPCLQCQGGSSGGIQLSAQELLGIEHHEGPLQRCSVGLSSRQPN